MHKATDLFLRPLLGVDQDRGAAAVKLQYCSLHFFVVLFDEGGGGGGGGM